MSPVDGQALYLLSCIYSPPIRYSVKLCDVCQCPRPPVAIYVNSWLIFFGEKEKEYVRNVFLFLRHHFNGHRFSLQNVKSNLASFFSPVRLYLASIACSDLSCYSEGSERYPSFQTLCKPLAAIHGDRVSTVGSEVSILFNMVFQDCGNNQFSLCSRNLN